MPKRHVHAEMMMQYVMNPDLIVEVKDSDNFGVWVEVSVPSWVESCKYRFKPGQELPPKVGEKCLFWDGHDCDLDDIYGGILRSYSPKGFIDHNGLLWDNCKPAPKTKTYVKKAWEIVKWLEENGYTYHSVDGFWKKEGEVFFGNGMLKYCGKEKPNKWAWLPEWLEEVEDFCKEREEE